MRIGVTKQSKAKGVVSYLATVTNNAEPSSSSKTLWILPLPKVWSPIRVALWLSCRAPARISLADALPPFTSTARGAAVMAEPASKTTLCTITHSSVSVQTSHFSEGSGSHIRQYRGCRHKSQLHVDSCTARKGAYDLSEGQAKVGHETGDYNRLCIPYAVGHLHHALDGLPVRAMHIQGEKVTLDALWFVGEGGEATCKTAVVPATSLPSTVRMAASPGSQRRAMSRPARTKPPGLLRRSRMKESHPRSCRWTHHQYLKSRVPSARMRRFQLETGCRQARLQC